MSKASLLFTEPTLVAVFLPSPSTPPRRAQGPQVRERLEDVRARTRNRTRGRGRGIHLSAAGGGGSFLGLIPGWQRYSGRCRAASAEFFFCVSRSGRVPRAMVDPLAHCQACTVKKTDPFLPRSASLLFVSRPAPRFIRGSPLNGATRGSVFRYGLPAARKSSTRKRESATRCVGLGASSKNTHA